MAGKTKPVEVNLHLGDLKEDVQKAAKASGLDMNEFIVNAVQSAVRNRQVRKPDSFVKHGGKHLFGKTTGYEVTEDGRYYPAPSWTSYFDDLFAERGAIEQMANSLVAQLNERLIAVSKSIEKAKRDLIEDLGVDPDKDWGYYGGSKQYLKEMTPKPEGAETENPPGE